MPGPVGPDEIDALNEKPIPELLFTAFNELLVLSWNGHTGTVRQKDLVERALELDSSLTSKRLDHRCMLDLVAAYTGKGWHVVYDKPGYNEEGQTEFRLSKPHS